jgi:hypothetical protein
MKTLKSLLKVLVFLLLMTSCKKTEYRDQKPQLKIIVKDSGKNLVTGVSVNLYMTKEDFQEAVNLVKSGITDSTGMVLFTELEEVNYYFYAKLAEKSNLYGVVATSSPLEYGYIHVIETVIE